MPLPLTAEERLVLFEALDVPPHSTAFELEGHFGEDNAVERASFGTATQAVDALIALLNNDSATRLQSYIAEWKLLSTSELRLVEAEGAKGVVRDAEEKRRLVRSRIQVYIPLYRQGELRAHHKIEPGNRWLRG